ncbi:MULTISPECIES: aminotransferase-like domain-containing protein [Vibrio]|uniref:PLP-dependent aminotransferase family protein n=1 Tax=Vibrio ostreae TaxID=2841925 RepID=A0A975U719_9VIBR|nr:MULTISPECIES: PLP-dependent aminotransferase family protein [Vibrio]QXO15461.1 PLP-dependent aminotransferase family protein [Vibrio ostreae]WGY45407.1 PLP-dependent aminotransferase family protein [Vibrio sp. ABG19]
MSDTKFHNIAQIIEQRIEQGIYALNTKLPTHRALSEELNTTPATVAKAYKLLADKGRLESFVGRGTYVSRQSELNQVIQAPDDEHEYNFSILQPCLYKNVQPLQHAYQHAAAQLTADLIGYTEHSGHAAHRQAGVEWARHYGLEGGHQENTVLTNGAQHALFLLINTLTKPGDTIAVEELTYPGIMTAANLSGRHVVSLPMDHEGVIPQQLDRIIAEHKVSLAIVVPSHQNPTGVTMPEQRRREIARVIEQRNIWLVEDDIYAFLNPHPIPAISNFIPERAVHISSLSKAISPAMRCGFIKAPASLIHTLNAHIRTYTWLSSPINYVAAAHLINHGEAFRLAEQQRDTALERQAMLRDIFPQVGERFNGYHVWLPLPAHWRADRLVMAAKDRQVIVSSGSYFDVSGDDSSHIRLSLMSVSREDKLQEGLLILKQLIDSDVSSLFPF